MPAPRQVTHPDHTHMPLASQVRKGLVIKQTLY